MSKDKYTSEIPYGYCHCGCGQKTNIADRTRPKLGLVKGEPRRFLLNHAHHTMPDIERFWSKVLIGSSDECWLWNSGKDNDGYGIFYSQGKTVRATRFIWQHLNGEIAPEMLVCHICDNPSCVNPKHLFLGTNHDNVKDMVLKGRAAHGERNYNHKLTSQQVSDIKRLYQSGNITKADIAKQYGVSDVLICYIINGKAWRHIK